MDTDVTCRAELSELGGVFFLHPVMSCDTSASQLHRPLLCVFVNVSLWMQQASKGKMQWLEVCPVQGAFLKYIIFQFYLKNP